MAKTKNTIKTIDATPTWEGVVRIYLAVLDDKKAPASSKESARSEILRAARIADTYVAEHSAK